MESTTPIFAVETFKSLGDKTFRGQSMFGIIMTWIMLICVIIGLLFIGRVIQTEDQKSQLSQLHQTTELWAEAFSIRLNSDLERLNQLHHALPPNQSFHENLQRLQTQSRELMQDRDEILEIDYTDSKNQVLASFASPHPFGDITFRVGEFYRRAATAAAISRAKRTGSSSFSEPYSLPIEGSPFIDLASPAVIGDRAYLQISRISIWSLLRQATQNRRDSSFRTSLLYNGTPIVAASTDSHRQTITYRMKLEPLPAGFELQVSSYAQGLLTQNTLFWVISALGIFLIVALLGLIRFNWRQNSTETALRAETALRKTIADSQLSGLQVTDRNGRIVYTNRTFTDLLGLNSNDNLIGQLPPYSYWPEGDARVRLMELFDTIKRGQTTTTSYEFHPIRPDGSTFSAFIYISPMITVEGTQLGWLWTLTDISEIRQAQERVTAAHERFTRVLESMQDAISVVDPQSNVLLFSNTVYDKLFGPDSSGHLQAHKEFVSQHREKPISQTGDITADIYMEETDKWFELHERTITWTDRTEVRLQILSDITERRRNENLLAEQQARSELNSRLVTMGEMASSLAHELNQPLTAISNYAYIVGSMMQKAGVPEDHEMFYSVSRIGAQAQRAAGIIQRIRSFTKRSEPKMESIPVINLVKEVMELANIQARRHKAKLQYYIAQDISNVWCDEIMIEQVLLNLIKNGIEASAGIAGQKPEVTLTIYSTIEHNVVFEVADNGSGIDDEHKAQLFDPFFTTKSTGMGMGLNICRTIVELHHGRLTISDNIGRGTIFTLMLPSEKQQTV